MTNKLISEYTEQEFLEFVRSICNAEAETEEDDVRNVLEFERLAEHPDGSDIIFYPRDGQEDTPEGVVQKIKEWRAANGKPGFKPE